MTTCFSCKKEDKNNIFRTVFLHDEDGDIVIHICGECDTNG